MANPQVTINLSADNTPVENVNQNAGNPKTDSAVSDYSHVPEEMKQLPHWVVATASKLPINPASGYGAKANDSSTWNSFEVCYSYLKENYGKEVIKDPGRAYEPITLGEDEYFVLGDNRNHSSDSRDPSVGILTRDDLIGRAWVRIYPFKTMGVIKHE